MTDPGRSKTERGRAGVNPAPAAPFCTSIFCEAARPSFRAFRPTARDRCPQADRRRSAPEAVAAGTAGRRRLTARTAGPVPGPSADVSVAGVISGGGRLIGPGSCPPANFTIAAMRLSIEGWVANRSAKPSRGLSTHISMTAEVAPGSSPRPSILRSAEIMASGFLVSSTEPASARYSRCRDSAKRITIDSSHASASSASAMRIATTAPPLPRSLLLLLLRCVSRASSSRPGTAPGKRSRQRTRLRRR